ncbi:hypothetical protein EGR_07469 [Echinococcus granulosus]|uniref:Uncharacterized protein n=1 Tax=Echinococcus granulosus TaxID=6210 RepID=W6UHT9_ECHGR|nr:hypothetical protein EGR_07469 [Echinococcus granulosus]EUB57662.1 hypothetical protein EGR_07469 [Echinococcus granulosus]
MQGVVTEECFVVPCDPCWCLTRQSWCHGGVEVSPCGWRQQQVGRGSRLHQHAVTQCGGAIHHFPPSTSLSAFDSTIQRYPNAMTELRVESRQHAKCDAGTTRRSAEVHQERDKCVQRRLITASLLLASTHILIAPRGSSHLVEPFHSACHRMALSPSAHASLPPRRNAASSLCTCVKEKAPRRLLPCNRDFMECRADHQQHSRGRYEVDLDATVVKPCVCQSVRSKRARPPPFLSRFCIPTGEPVLAAWD